jgi:23S rRNA (cytidine1920-2'-O)/16S rRNA (cytidine1409-2'-O)-methyltransferase
MGASSGSVCPLLASLVSPENTRPAITSACARVLTPAQIDAPCNWVVCDASFIALAKVLERPLELAAPHCRLVALIKPQFEVGREEVGKGGVVRSTELHARVCGEVREWLGRAGWTVDGLTTSPITGPEGNVEFLIAARRGHVAPAAPLGQDGAPGESAEAQ